VRRRFATWRSVVDHVRAHNTRAASGLETYTQEVNYFSDLTMEEIKRDYLGPDRAVPVSNHVVAESNVSAPLVNVDWCSMIEALPCSQSVAVVGGQAHQQDCDLGEEPRALCRKFC
jgi:hypothetical protein